MTNESAGFVAGVLLATDDRERYGRGSAGHGCGGVPVARSSLTTQSCFATRKEGYCYNDTGAGLSIKCVCMSFSSIISVVFTFTRANVSILTFLFVFYFNHCRMGRLLRFS